MSVGSNINPNFPLPGVDQSSRGFRDNFATAKKEIENIQSKQIQLVGDVTSNVAMIDSGTGVISIQTSVLTHNVSVSGNQHALLFNDSGAITTTTSYWDSGNAAIGIGTSSPQSQLDVKGNLQVGITNILKVDTSGGNVKLTTLNASGLTLGTNNNVAVTIDTLGQVGIGKIPGRVLDVVSGEYDVARFSGTLSSTDLGVRLTTAQATSTVAWIVENSNNYAGGIRADQNGLVSLHAGESPASGMQDGTKILTLHPVTKHVGIGTSSASALMHVAGNAIIDGTLQIGASVPTLLGSRGGNAALTNLITLLASMGLIVDGTSA